MDSVTTTPRLRLSPPAFPRGHGVRLPAAAPPDRLTLAVLGYLLLPLLIFLAGWCRPWVALPCLAAGLLAFALAPGWWLGAPLSARGRVLCLIGGLAWAGLSGMHHLLPSMADWQVRDAVLRDLAVQPWPVAYRLEDQLTWLLRAPLGLYLPAAVVGRLAGLAAAQAALWAWVGLGLGLGLALLRSLAASRREALVLVVAFGLFGGLEFVALSLWHAATGQGLTRGWGHSFEWWAGLFQYSGHVTLVLWVPNHALPAWLCVLLLLRHGAAPGFQAMAVPLYASAAFWGPLGVAMAALLQGAAALDAGPWRALRAALSPANLLAMPALGLPVLAYLLAGAAAIPSGLLLDLHPAGAALPAWVELLALEVLPFLPFALATLRPVLFAATALMLAGLPTLVYGPSNDLVMRGGIAPLAVLAVGCGAALARLQGWRRAALLAAVLACSAAGSLNEASPLVTARAWPSSRQCNLPQAAGASIFEGASWRHYLTPWGGPGWLGLLLRQPVAEAPSGQLPCWPPDNGPPLP